MNILFVNNSEINPLNSGIQRITSIMARAFKAKGIDCYGAYFEVSFPSEKALFQKKIKLSYTEQSIIELTNFIIKFQIQQIIVQECWPLKKLEIVRKALKNITDCQLIYCYHNTPGKEFIRPCLNVEFYRFWYSVGKINSLKKISIALLPSFIYSFLVRKRVKLDYSFIYQNADKIILLSDSYIPTFIKLSESRIKDTSKFMSIGNSLSFKNSLAKKTLFTKQKEVLIVGRLSDRQKRISLALKIWQQVEQTELFKDWRLKILGSGPDEKYYHHLSRKLKLKQVDFEGKQDPQPYYQRASIFMLTSSYEGFGMVLTEAQQMGTVPVAFDSYTAVHDIIENAYNGYIIPNGDIKAYTNNLIYLMKHTEERERLAINGLISCQKFSENRILEKWLNIFK